MARIAFESCGFKTREIQPPVSWREAQRRNFVSIALLLAMASFPRCRESLLRAIALLNLELTIICLRLMIKLSSLVRFCGVRMDILCHCCSSPSCRRRVPVGRRKGCLLLEVDALRRPSRRNSRRNHPTAPGDFDNQIVELCRWSSYLQAAGEPQSRVCVYD